LADVLATLGDRCFERMNQCRFIMHLEHPMRLTTLLSLPLFAGLIAAPTVVPAQVQISVQFGTRLGPEIGVFAYSQERHGDWRNNYRRWTPVTLYDVNGRYYRTNVRGSRAVAMYTYQNEYFLPPSDQEWVGRDTRYNYGRRPNESDMGRARPWERREAVDPRMGAEIGVLGYSEDRAGDWRKNSRRWSPVTVYEVNGRYYPRNGRGAREVMVYRFRNEYFLPPTDDKWNNSDKRFDYKHAPDANDRGRVRGRP
jgi:hypothetical protein